MRTTIAGPQGAANAGEVVSHFTPELERTLVRDGYAEPVGRAPAPAAALPREPQEPETATVTPPEGAVLPKPKKKGKGK
jgi:hypothetical protein